MNFTFRTSTTQKAHWEACEKRHVPYIEISDVNERYQNIFYDVTNLPGDLEQISEDVKKLYSAYIEFCLIPRSDVEYLFDQYYFFNLAVKSEHAQGLAQQLFVYLCEKIGIPSNPPS
ncbi:hypothetical protein [Pseudomonas guariconensis]|uniref:hypothetical protein n=1 Tax=Pseudomonas guariconensis TaxID=1288410 RepID=UPI0018A9D1B9|nr:hypothetical protein [Pseudomonas guariconensis]MBF8720931.1 hypothetical protein [Pseudomonas guariconensis]MBF8791241.1 hypothetical protein [Pseudomonas monteilii]